MTGVKMITCCYCGARDMFSMGKGKRVALSCLSCGAPVRKMETVRNDSPVPAPAPMPERVNKHRRRPHYEAVRKRKKKRKSLLSRVWDEIDDVLDLDDIFDFD